MRVYYECQRCTACCRWPGQVVLGDAETAGLARLRNLTESDFIQRFTRIREDRQGLALQDKLNGECVFLEGGACAVESAKPQQCRDFPNGWNFPGFGEFCRAIPKVVPDAEYERLMGLTSGATG